MIQQDEFPCQLVVIGRHLLAEHDQRRIPVAFFDVAEHLVVGTVLLDDAPTKRRSSLG
jgi:hypothetical protein